MGKWVEDRLFSWQRYQFVEKLERIGNSYRAGTLGDGCCVSLDRTVAALRRADHESMAEVD